MYTRLLAPPERSCCASGCVWVRSPGRFTQGVEALPARSWVVVDEVQRLPTLLVEVQD